MTTIQNEFERLSRVFERIGAPLKKAPPASLAKINSIAKTTGINLDDNLKELWQISDGSRRYSWFANGEDEDFTPHDFLPVKEVLARWNSFAPYDKALYARWYDDESWGERDPRIQRHFLRHSKWLAVTDSYSGNEQLQFDADPTNQGTYGQLNLFTHDPDGVFWCDRSFLTFFKRSNDLLEVLSDDPELLIERMELQDTNPSPFPGLNEPGTCHQVEFNFHGIRVTWLESAKGRASTARQSNKSLDPSENWYRVIDVPFTLTLDRGQLLFEDDGLVFEFGSVQKGDDIRVAGYNEIYVNGKLRSPLIDL